MASNYWQQRVLADERRSTQIAQNASAEMAKMYRTQYLRVVKEIEGLKGEIDYGGELSRTQLWNYARWRRVEETLRDFVTEAVTIDTQVIHDALDAEFERVIGMAVTGYGGALGAGDSILLGAARKARILSGDWSGEHYSARIWKNSNAIADRMRNEITEMLVDGKSMQDIRRAVMKEFGVSYHNADRLVQTEVSYVHNQLALEEYRDLGLDQVQILTEANACEVCQEFPGQPYDINSAPFIPAHPRCRCCYAPWTYSDRKKWAEEHPEEGQEKEHLLEVVDVTPEGSGDLAFKIRPTERALQTLPRDGILGEPGTKAGEESLKFLCNLDESIYNCIRKEITTTETIIHEKRVQHIFEEHPEKAHEKVIERLAGSLMEPDYILKDRDPNVGVILKSYPEDGEQYRIVLHLAVPGDEKYTKNSIITAFYIGEGKIEKYTRNKIILYKRPGL